MKQIYIIKESKKIRTILDESYEAFLAALKTMRPNAQSLIEDDIMAQAHDAYALIKNRKMKIQQIEIKNKMFIFLEIET